MTIKGTLETFNLRELLQMLAFNQKVGTLVLETARGPQTVYVDRGRVAFVVGDEKSDDALLRVVRRSGFVPQDKLERALGINRSSGRHLGTILSELGMREPDALAQARLIAAEERFLALQLTSVSHFEFVDGKAISPSGQESEPLEPSLVVDGLLLDLTRKMDQWAELARVVPGTSEVYETTGVCVELVDLLKERGVDTPLAERVIAAYDGYRTLDQIVEASFADPLTVMEVTAAMVETGGLRAVPVEDLLTRGGDLLARGDAHQAMPLYRRAVEREGTPLEARLHLADALEATGERKAAAAELETLAALQDGAAPEMVFDALDRARALRDGELAASTRVCDHFLRNRPWLQERKEAALQGLRTLIHGAVTSRQPLEAAERLAQFIANGDSPSEDLLVLADLYASGGARTEAAGALFQRAEDLRSVGRTGPCRELLERTLQLDPTRADARSRLQELVGSARRKRQRRRLFVFLVLLALLLLGAGTAWWSYNQEANRAVRSVKETAELAVTTAEGKAYALLSSFEDRVNRAETAAEPDEGLVEASEQMRSEVRKVLGGADTALYAFASELERYQATDHQDTYAVMLRQLNARRETTLARAEDLIRAKRKLGQTSLVAGERAHREGRFVEAQRQLVAARNLSFDDAALRSRAVVLLSHVERYVREFETALAAYQAASDPVEAFRRGAAIFTEQRDSDLTKGVRLSVRVTSSPAGAEVRLGEGVVGKTPCDVEYSPFESTALVVWTPGHVPQEYHLPSYADLVTNPAAWEDWEPAVAVSMRSGPSWRIQANEGPFGSLWAASGVPVLATADGSALQTVNVEGRRAGIRLEIRRPNPIRHGGSLPGHVEWRIVGNHTLVVLPPDGKAWETQVLGRLERAPVVRSGVLVVVDEMGTVYGLDVANGKERWRQALKSPPCHAPQLSALGILVSTYNTGVFALDAATGRRRDLAVDARGHTLALRLGSDVVVLGTSSHQVRRYAATGTPVVLGEAHLVDRAEPWVSDAGVAWVEGDGVRWLAASAEAPVLVSGLGADVVEIAGDGDTMYAAGADGVIRAVSLDAPERTLWETTAGSQVTAPPLPLGDYLFVLVDGGLTALAR